MSHHRKRKQRDHRRGKSVEEIAQKELMIIMDENDIGSLDPLLSDTEMDDDNDSPHLHLERTSLDSLPSTESVDAILNEIDTEISDQYEPPPIKNRSARSDSHYNASTPLVVKKYTLKEVTSMIINRKPELVNADKLALLIDVSKEDEREQALLQKLSLCEVVNLDFRIKIDGVDGDSDMDELKAIENKKNLLKECSKYLTTLKGQWSSIAILDQIFRTVQVNLFRSLPDAYIIEEFEGIDNPTKYTLPRWSHLQFVYELLFQVIMNKNIDKLTLQKYLSGSFLSNFVQIFHSLCKAEVDYVKILVHSIYLDFVPLRDETRIALSQYCWDFIYCDNGTADGINAILDIINSILQGLDDDKLANDGWLMVLYTVLCPLHKGKQYEKYQSSLHKCIKTYIKSQPEHLIVVLNHGLFRFWPQTNPSKEVMFVKEILNLLKIVKRAKLLCKAHFAAIFERVVQQMRLNLLSSHYQIVQETIESIKERLMRQCIDFHAGESGWSAIYKSLIFATHNHFLYLTKNAAKQMMDWLKKYRITKKYIASFEKLEIAYSETSDKLEFLTGCDVTKNKTERQNKWKSLTNLAQTNKAKMKKTSNKNEKKIQKTGDDEDKLAHLFVGGHQNENENGTKFSFHRSMISEPISFSFESLPSLNPQFEKRASALENDFGYPRVHRVYKMYRQQKRISCSKQERLVLFGKKNGIHISYSETSKYFKMRLKAKKINQHRRSKKLKKRISTSSTKSSPLLKSLKSQRKTDELLSASSAADS